MIETEFVKVVNPQVLMPIPYQITWEFQLLEYIENISPFLLRDLINFFLFLTFVSSNYDI